MAGLYGSLIFNFLGDRHTVFVVDAPIHNPAKIAQGFPFLQSLVNASYPGRYETMSFMVSIYISLMTTDGEHVFMCLLAICMSSLEKYPFRSFAHLLIGLLGFFLFFFF